MERLRNAIEKARAQRHALTGSEAPAPSRARVADEAPARRGQAAWDALETLKLDDQHLAAERIVAWQKSDSAHLAFDVLRTQILRVLRENGWRKVLITSPGKTCGKTTVATNLAISLARHAAVRTLLVDLDMRNPRIASCLGLGGFPISIAEWLGSEAQVESQFIRVGDNLAVCLNTVPTKNPAEFLQDAGTARRLEAAIDELAPSAVIYDMPPMLISDDVLGFLPQVDCTLLVAGAGQTTAEEIDECERLLEGSTNFLGVLLNKCTLPPNSAYRDYEYDKAAGAAASG